MTKKEGPVLEESFLLSSSFLRKDMGSNYCYYWREGNFLVELENFHIDLTVLLVMAMMMMMTVSNMLPL